MMEQELPLNLLPTRAALHAHDIHREYALQRRTVAQLRARVKHLRKFTKMEALAERLVVLSKGYGSMNKSRLVTTVLYMEWEYSNYSKTGKTTLGVPSWVQ